MDYHLQERMQPMYASSCQYINGLRQKTADRFQKVSDKALLACITLDGLLGNPSITNADTFASKMTPENHLEGDSVGTGFLSFGIPLLAMSYVSMLLSRKQYKENPNNCRIAYNCGFADAMMIISGTMTSIGAMIKWYPQICDFINKAAEPFAALYK